jgi:hypothetical protein
MKLMRLVGLTCLWTGVAVAQTAATDAAAGCPSMSEDVAKTVRWDAMRIPNMLLCRAILNETGTEAFAMTISSDTPFRPKRSLRAETGVLDGREVQWYRGEVANEPTAQIRETLIELEDDRIVHIFMRAPDAETLAARLKMAEALKLAGI